MPTRKHSPRQLKDAARAEAGFSASEAYFLRNLPELLRDPARQLEQWQPKDIRRAMIRNRELTDNPFVGLWCRVRRWFFDDRFAFRGEDDKLTKWLDDKGVRRLMRRLQNDIWEEFLLQDNVVVFWMKPSGKNLPKPVVLHAEICTYRNGLGGERLTVKFAAEKLSDEEKRGMEPRWIEAREQGKEITLDPDKGECFAVLTRSMLGQGFGMPRLRQAYRFLGVLENLGVGDWAGSYWIRDVIRHIKIGFEPKLNELAGKPEVWDITKAEKEQVQKSMKTKRGASEVVSSFKVKIDFAHLDPKYFDKTKYEGVMSQFDRWGGAGLLLLAAGAESAPFLVSAFRAEGLHDRGLVGDFLDGLLADPDFLPIKAPKPLHVRWNPHTFRDAKTLVEAVRFLKDSGSISNQTTREIFDLDHPQEGERLKAELADPKANQPTFEPKQGMLTEKPNGRPPANPPAA